MGEHALLLLCGLVLDWFIGDPVRLWQRLPHPVAGFGKIIDILDSAFNSDCDAPVMAMRKGSLAISLLIIAAIVMGLIFSWLISCLGGFGWLAEILIIWILLAQKSLLDHVGDVARGLRENGLEGGRQAVSLIVGRDSQMLDESGICGAAIESLAENFCDGVVAPAFWYLVFGLPGLFAYKMINTADSMIAYKNRRYLYFGRATAQIDDLANWLPARLSAVLISAGGSLIFGIKTGLAAIATALRDSGLHRSPNAGWPEAAMAGACGLALGGPRLYKDEKVSQAFINGAGKRALISSDISIAQRVFSHACFCLWGSVMVYFAVNWVVRALAAG